MSTTKPGSMLKRSIPIRTFSDWEEGRPGFLEVDLVVHCGESAEGFYLSTLNTVDVQTGWVECHGVWGKGQEKVRGAIHQVRKKLPFALLGLDSDNGSEFINHELHVYCEREGITFTRSRPYKKNDSAHVEQKNWTVVRQQLGYDRYSSREALDQLNHVYGLLRLHVNFFQPVMKLMEKTRDRSQGSQGLRHREDALPQAAGERRAVTPGKTRAGRPVPQSRSDHAKDPARPGVGPALDHGR